MEGGGSEISDENDTFWEDQGLMNTVGGWGETLSWRRVSVRLRSNSDSPKRKRRCWLELPYKRSFNTVLPTGWKLPNR